MSNQTGKRSPQKWFTADLHLGHDNIIDYCDRPFRKPVPIPDNVTITKQNGNKIATWRTNSGRKKTAPIKDDKMLVPDVQAMDKRIIDGINEKVRPGDQLFILGDFAKPLIDKDWIEQWIEYRNQIHCKNIVLVLGNHDPHQRNYMPDMKLWRVFKDTYNSTVVREKINGENIKIYLHHYACRVWPNSHHGAWHLYGHSHGMLSQNPWDQFAKLAAKQLCDELKYEDPEDLKLFEGILSRVKISDSLSMDVGVDCHNFDPVSLDDVAKFMSTRKWKSPLEN